MNCERAGNYTQKQNKQAFDFLFVVLSFNVLRSKAIVGYRKGQHWCTNDSKHMVALLNITYKENSFSKINLMFNIFIQMTSTPRPWLHNAVHTIYNCCCMGYSDNLSGVPYNTHFL